MSPLIVPAPDIFAALAFGAPHGDPDVADDPDLQPGIHLRLLPSPALGFPLAPFGIFKVTPLPVDVGDVIWRDREGHSVGPFLANAGGILTVDVAPPAAGGVWVAIELLTDRLDGQLTLLDRVDNRVLAVRRKPPWIFGGPRVDRLRIEGRALELSIRMWRIDVGRSLEALMGAEPRLLGLPIDGDRPWYARGPGPDPAFARVERGAPKRLGPPDRADGSYDRLDPANERARIEVQAPDLDAAIETMLDDTAILPSAQQWRVTNPGSQPRQIVGVHLAGALLAQAMDPGLGRYLGVVDVIDERPTWNPPAVYAAVGWFAIDTHARLADGRVLNQAVGTFEPFVTQICEHYAETIGVKDAIAEMVARLGPGRLVARGLIALAAAAPPPRPPDLPRPELGVARWLPPPNAPSTDFQQQLVISSPPLGSLLAVAKLTDAGTWDPQNAKLDLPPGTDPPSRRQPILLGRTRERPPFAASGLITAAPVTAGKDNRYNVALADLFGRFGTWIEIPVHDPDRPGPPPPAPQADVLLDGPDGDDGPKASPGHLRVRVPVPSVTELAAGSLGIATIELRLDGALEAQDAVPEPAAHEIAVYENSIALPELEVGGQGHCTLEAVFVDTGSVRSLPAEITIGYADRRKPPTILTAIGIYWTSRPGPSDEVELKLRWPGAEHVQYRVYIADAKSLKIDGASRAVIAAEGGHRDRDHRLGGRESFRLLTEPPLLAAGGTVTLNERLPRALQTVQFLRIVPATDRGREADFDSCPVVAVAVPSDRRPPPPRIEIQLSPDGTHATITVQAIGLDLVELQDSEPGLFTDPPDAAARPPQFRLRRAIGPIAAPQYAREIARGALKASDVDGTTVFAAPVEDPRELKPFVRYTYWAEVQMPSERRVEAGAEEIPPPGGVGPIEPAQIADLPRLFSPASAPVPVLARPPGPPKPLAGASAAIANEGGQVRATLTAPATPDVDKAAIGPYRLRIWEQWDGKDIEAPAPDVEVDGGPLEWAGPLRSAGQSLTLHMVVIDPLGRESAITAADAQ